MCFDQAKFVFTFSYPPLPSHLYRSSVCCLIKGIHSPAKRCSTHEYTLTCKEMSTHPRKSSTLAPPLFFLERADCATCLKKRLRPFSPDTSFSFLAASITEKLVVVVPAHVFQGQDTDDDDDELMLNVLRCQLTY